MLHAYVRRLLRHGFWKASHGSKNPSTMIHIKTKLTYGRREERGQRGRGETGGGGGGGGGDCHTSDDLEREEEEKEKGEVEAGGGGRLCGKEEEEEEKETS